MFLFFACLAGWLYGVVVHALSISFLNRVLSGGVNSIVQFPRYRKVRYGARTELSF